MGEQPNVKVGNPASSSGPVAFGVQTDINVGNIPNNSGIIAIGKDITITVTNVSELIRSFLPITPTLMDDKQAMRGIWQMGVPEWPFFKRDGRASQDVPRKLYHELFQRITNPPNPAFPYLQLLFADNGWGKTILMMRLASELCRLPDYAVLWLRPTASDQAASFTPQISEVAMRLGSGRKLFVLIDDILTVTKLGIFLQELLNLPATAAQVIVVGSGQVDELANTYTNPYDIHDILAAFVATPTNPDLHLLPFDNDELRQLVVLLDAHQVLCGRLPRPITWRPGNVLDTLGPPLDPPLTDYATLYQPRQAMSLLTSGEAIKERVAGNISVMQGNGDYRQPEQRNGMVNLYDQVALLDCTGTPADHAWLAAAAQRDPHLAVALNAVYSGQYPTAGIMQVQADGSITASHALDAQAATELLHPDEQSQRKAYAALLGLVPPAAHSAALRMLQGLLGSSHAANAAENVNLVRGILSDAAGKVQQLINTANQYQLGSGWSSIYRRIGDLDRATQMSTGVINQGGLAQDIGPAHYNRALAYQAAGRSDLAAADFAQARRLFRLPPNTTIPPPTPPTPLPHPAHPLIAPTVVTTSTVALTIGVLAVAIVVLIHLLQPSTDRHYVIIAQVQSSATPTLAPPPANQTLTNTPLNASTDIPLLATSTAISVLPSATAQSYVPGTIPTSQVNTPAQASNPPITPSPTDTPTTPSPTNTPTTPSPTNTPTTPSPTPNLAAYTGPWLFLVVATPGPPIYLSSPDVQLYTRFPRLDIVANGYLLRVYVASEHPNVAQYDGSGFVADFGSGDVLSLLADNGDLLVTDRASGEQERYQHPGTSRTCSIDSHLALFLGGWVNQSQAGSSALYIGDQGCDNVIVVESSDSLPIGGTSTFADQNGQTVMYITVPTVVPGASPTPGWMLSVDNSDPNSPTLSFEGGVYKPDRIWETPTPLPTSTATPITPTDTPTITPSPTDTLTLPPTNTDTPTITATPINTDTPTVTATDTPAAPTDTPMVTATYTPATSTDTPTMRATDTPAAPTDTPTDTPTTTPLPTPYILAPADGATLDNADFDFSWATVEGAASYNLELQLCDQDFKQCATYTTIPASSTSQAAYNILNGKWGWYQWRVYAVDGNDVARSVSGWSHFSLMPLTPPPTPQMTAPPQLLSPPDGAGFPDANFTFSWAAVEGAVSYAIVIKSCDQSYNNCQDLVAPSVDGGATKLDASQYLADQHGWFMWSVWAIDQYNNSLGSQPWRFKIP